VLRGVIVSESIAVAVMKSFGFEVPLKFTERSIVVLPTGVAHFGQVIEQVNELILRDLEMTRRI
jgi:hypothetical protein